MNTPTKKYFGTDGIRGRVGTTPITVDFFLKLGWAAGRVLNRMLAGGRKTVLIGKDTRVSGYMFEAALEAGLVAAGLDVILVGPMPTPGVALLTCELKASMGIMISASHNPHEDNGIKFFNAAGQKLDDETEFAIEAELDSAITTEESAKLGKATRYEAALEHYINWCKHNYSKAQLPSDVKIVLDCANGANYLLAPKLFAELGLNVIDIIGNQPNGCNINTNVGATDLRALRDAVLRTHADVGIAFDGDGDRLIMVDRHGKIVDGDELLFIIAVERAAQNRLGGGVVGTVMTNAGMELALKARDIPFVRTQVGDRYIIEELKKRNWLLGGESSGHIICLDVVTTGDAIVSALEVLAAMQRSGCSLSQLKKGMHKLPQRLVNVRLMRTANVITHPKVLAAVKDAEAELHGAGRVLLRNSGTEPLIRVMVEGENEQSINALAESIANVIEELERKLVP